MIEDDYMKPGPVKVLCAGGVFTNEADERIIAKYAEPRVAPDPVRRVNIKPAFTPTALMRSRGKRPVGRPRTRPAKQPGRGQAWNKIQEVSAERIIELQREGLTADQIGEKLGCTRFTVYSRLRVARRLSPEAAKTDEMLRTCACGNRKWACRATCSYCADTFAQDTHRNIAQTA